MSMKKKKCQHKTTYLNKNEKYACYGCKRVYALQKILKEKLASIEHTRWADWQKWCHKILRENCSSPELEKVLERWDKQIATDYKDLSEKEKDSDRKQVDRYLPLLRQSLTEILDEVKGEYKIIGSRAHCLSCGGYKAADECFCAAHNARESELRERIKLLKK